MGRPWARLRLELNLELESSGFAKIKTLASPLGLTLADWGIAEVEE